MEAPPRPALSWEDLVGVVARFTELPPESIGRESWLIEDLGLDSLALTELLVTLIDEHNLLTLDEDLFERSWEQVTLGHVYEKYCHGDGATFIGERRNGSDGSAAG